ncbi:MAG TPA: hypothetical protein VM619_15100 [Luteimonas sp.]|nr:hypothetical protein [Luteimonas sp.]
MRTLILGALLLLPLAAQADDRRCEHAQPRDLQLDLAGVKTVVFEIGANEVDVRAGTGNRIEGQACASSENELARLTLSQRKSGDRLVVTARREDGALGGLFFGNHYAYMKLHASVPADVMVQLDIGSGDGSVEGVRAASIDVGSGDGRASGIRGEVTAKVGSGDVVVEDARALHLLSVGSGDATARNIGGPSRVGSVGSGDLGIRGTRGPVEIGSLGSGDIDLRDIGGGVTVGSIGSGDVGASSVRGDLVVRSIGSGDVDHDGVTGRVDLPRED